DGPLVVVPPGRLNAVPWGLLPSLAGRAVSVAPSARAWFWARTAGPFGLDKTVLVAGPGLGAASAEVRTLATEYGRAARRPRRRLPRRGRRPGGNRGRLVLHDPGRLVLRSTCNTRYVLEDAVVLNSK